MKDKKMKAVKFGKAEEFKQIGRKEGVGDIKKFADLKKIKGKKR